MRRDDITTAPIRESHGVRRFGDSRVRPFGSFARDEASRDNDLDALVDNMPLRISESEDD